LFQITTGGKENRLQVWDVNRPDASPVFAAKNVKPDTLQLRVPVWITDICFPDALAPSSIATVSRHGHIRYLLFSNDFTSLPTYLENFQYWDNIASSEKNYD
jgi:hypothetical protein